VPRTTLKAGETENLIIQRHGPVVVLVLNRPQANNAITDGMRDELLSALGQITKDATIGCVVLAGAGDNLSVGGEISELATLTPMEAETYAAKAAAVNRAMAALPQPTIAAMKGACIGSGLELALCCDIRIARMDARIGLPGINLGIVPGGGSIARLSRLVGSSSARALAMTGAVVAADRAFMAGLVTNVVSHDDFDAAIQQMAQHMAALPQVAVAELKHLFDMSLDQGVDAVQAEGVRAFTRCYADGEAAQRFRLMFGGPDPGATLH